jgi:hypothetical protein
MIKLLPNLTFEELSQIRDRISRAKYWKILLWAASHFQQESEAMAKKLLATTAVETFVFEVA